MLISDCFPGHNLKLYDKHQKKHFLTYSTLWNSLPNHVLSAASVNSFKKRLDDYIILLTTHKALRCLSSTIISLTALSGEITSINLNQDSLVWSFYTVAFPDMFQHLCTVSWCSNEESGRCKILLLVTSTQLSTSNNPIAFGGTPGLLAAWGSN